MGSMLAFLIILVTGTAFFLLARVRALRVAGGDVRRLHSRPNYFGAYAAVLAVLPAVIVLVAGMIAASAYVAHDIRSSFPQDVQTKSGAEQAVVYQMVSSIAAGLNRMTAEEHALAATDAEAFRKALGARGIPLAQTPQPYMIEAARNLAASAGTWSLAVGLAAIAASVGGGLYALSQVAPAFRARNRVEQVMLAALILCSTIAILTTFGIVGSLISETLRFFAVVPPTNFFFGTVWDPRFSTDGSSVGQFGLIPLLLGTLYIALVAMLIAVPIGLFAAIYMAEYASSRLRSIVKPLLEILAGIPTIVYGFFALVTVGPLFRDFSASLWGALTGNYLSFIQAQSVLTAGFVMSIRLIPFVSSLSDDIITAVPRSLRDGSLGLGATRSETVKKVILPAALPGIMGALLLTASRAIGETMIVVLAAGVAANLQFLPFEPMTTITVKIVNQLTGDLEFNSPQTLVAFALGMTLFVLTLAMNVYALYIVRKYREQYE